MYSLIETEAYTGARILVVGGGDSAVEAAMGLAHQKGNQVRCRTDAKGSAESKSATSTLPSTRSRAN